MGHASLGMLVLITSLSIQSLAVAQVPVTVRGEVTLVTAELCIVKDGNGKGVLINLDKKTAIEGTLAVGKTIEAVMAPDGRGLSIKVVR